MGFAAFGLSLEGFDSWGQQDYFALSSPSHTLTAKNLHFEDICKEIIIRSLKKWQVIWGAGKLS